jgi:hypothetical protein
MIETALRLNGNLVTLLFYGMISHSVHTLADEVINFD